MMRVGYFLSSEEHSPKDLLRHAVMAQEAGFTGLWISDHYHPWNDRQGHSGFVWATIGALAQVTPGMHVATAVTCPTIRIHPAVIAQAAATAAVLLDGRFTLGVGSGEALNEHIFGDSWPRAAVRRDMLREAVEVIRMLWEEGTHSHEGRHYTVDNARVYDLPERPPEILVSGFGERAIDLAAEIGDGFATIEPDGDAVQRFLSNAKRGRRVTASVKVCWHPDETRGRELAHELWPNDALPGELAQVLPTPAHFEQANELVTVDMVAEKITSGPDLDKHVATLKAYEDAGFDELYVQQIGPDPTGFFEAYRESVLPLFAGDRTAN